MHDEKKEQKTCLKCGGSYEGPWYWEDGTCPACWRAYSTAARIMSNLVAAPASFYSNVKHITSVDQKTMEQIGRDALSVCDRLAVELRYSGRKAVSK
jgi:hypothetical protein